MRRKARSSDGEVRRRSGIALVECLVYMSLWLIIVGLAFDLFYQAYTQSKHLARNADDIVRVLKAGERWRAEVRNSPTPLRWEAGDGASGRMLVLGPAEDRITYRCTATNVVRRTEKDPRWQEVVGGLQAGTFHRDERGPVVVWRWELELKPRVRDALIDPRFTFQSVPSSAQGGRP